MSSVETPPPPTPVERRCPRCDARLSAEQEWCLECGAAVGTRIAEPRGWRASLAIVGVLLALALIAVVLAIVELSRRGRDACSEVAGTPTRRPPPAGADRDARAGDEGGATPERRRRAPRDPVGVDDAGGRRSEPRPPASPSGPRARRPGPIVINSSARARTPSASPSELAAKGVPDVGVLDSERLRVAGPGLVRRLQRPLTTRRPRREAALAKIRDQAGGGSTRRIVPAK